MLYPYEVLAGGENCGGSEKLEVAVALCRVEAAFRQTTAVVVTDTVADEPLQIVFVVGSSSGATFPRYLEVYEVWYRREPHFESDPDLTPANLHTTHVFVRRVTLADKDAVFGQMQGEVWSPKGEARTLINLLGLHHTSMSVGDVLHEVATAKWWECAFAGWRELGSAQ